jgi:hypothetical protein
MTDLDFAQAKTQRGQIVVACKDLGEFQGQNVLTCNAIARFMGIKHRATIENQFHKQLSSTAQPDRPPLLQGGAKSWIIECVDT